MRRVSIPTTHTLSYLPPCAGRYNSLIPVLMLSKDTVLGELTMAGVGNTTFPLWLLIGLVVLGGGIGGSAQFLVSIVPHDSDSGVHRHLALSSGQPGQVNPLTAGQFWALAVMGALIGIAGAIGLVGVFALLKVFDEGMLYGEKKVLVRLGLAVLGVSAVGGFGARRMLPILGDNLTKQVSEMKQEADKMKQEADKQAEENKKRQAELDQHKAQIEEQKRLLEQQKIEQQEGDKKLAELNRRAIIDGGFITLRTKSASRWKQARDEIVELRRRHPEDREASILAARFLTERLPDDSDPPDYHGAVAILSEFLTIENTQQSDISDILINRACYNVRLSQDAKDTAEQGRLRKLALADLERSFELKEANKVFAANDDDLSPLWPDPEFLALIAPEMPPDKGAADSASKVGRGGVD